MIYRVYVEKKENLQAKKIREDVRTQAGHRRGRRARDHPLRRGGPSLPRSWKGRSSTYSPNRPSIPSTAKSCPPTLRATLCLPSPFWTGSTTSAPDSAAQCIQLLTQKTRPLIKCARVIAVKGVSEEQVARIKKHLINPVERRGSVHGKARHAGAGKNADARRALHRRVSSA